VTRQLLLGAEGVVKAGLAERVLDRAQAAFLPAMLAGLVLGLVTAAPDGARPASDRADAVIRLFLRGASRPP
jgi:hypothetical protein